MKKMFMAAFAALALVVVQGYTAAAQMGLPASDGQFMVEAARGGVAEVEIGRLAAQRAASDAVRQFGQRMATDHSAVNQELMQLAQRKGVMLPREMDPSHRAAMDRLSTLTGPAFDQAYMTDMMRDHQHDLAAFTREAREGQDAEVRAWAAKTLPTIQEHQRLAYDLHARFAQVPAAQPPVVIVPPPPAVAAQPPAVVVTPPPAPVIVAPSASPPTVTVITTTPSPFCGGAYRPDAGTNFGGCTSY
jgi:putative membrane protein